MENLPAAPVALKTAVPIARPNPASPVVAPAGNAVSLHTGQPLTQADIASLLASAIKASGMQKQDQVTPSPSGGTTLTPGSLYHSGVIDTELLGVNTLWQSQNFLVFDGDETSSIVFYVAVKPNIAYVLDIKVTSVMSTQFTIFIGIQDGATPPQNTVTIAGNYATVTEYAYAFVSNSAGTIPVTLYGSGDGWNFNSAEIVSAAL